MTGVTKSPLGRYGTIPPSMRPLLRAYALGYITVTGPRLFGFLRILSRRNLPLSVKINLLYTILRTSTEPNRFPTACAIAVGGATALPRLIKTILQWLLQKISPNQTDVLGPKFTTRLRFVTTFLSGYLVFNLLNKDPAWSRKRALSASLNNPNQHHIPTSPTQFAGKTIDFTLFAFTRALDALTVHLWLTTKSSPRHPSKTHPALTSVVSSLGDPSIFALSAATIMFAWFYSPERLPKSYQNWISAAASIDPRLIETLRRVRRGEFIYGVDTGQTPLLAPLCRELKLPPHWADPKITVPVPCELYHSGAGPSCEVHALHRFATSFLFALRLYLPLNVLPRLFASPSSALRNPRVLTALLKSSVRSASFLAAFISSFYYAVCLARTRVGPKIVPLRVVTRQMWDAGLCTLAGCLACGWSVFIETPAKRQELAFFVAPRALGTLLPRIYDRRYIARERAVFAGSVAVVLTLLTSEQAKGRARGVFGKILEGVLKE